MAKVWCIKSIVNKKTKGLGEKGQYHCYNMWNPKKNLEVFQCSSELDHRHDILQKKKIDKKMGALFFGEEPTEWNLCVFSIYVGFVIWSTLVTFLVSTKRHVLSSLENRVLAPYLMYFRIKWTTFKNCLLFSITSKRIHTLRDWRIRELLQELHETGKAIFCCLNKS